MRAVLLISIALMCATFGAGATVASELLVRISDPDGEPVAGVAVFINLVGTDSNQSSDPQSAIMDQKDFRFVPHILMVETGGSVSFPNSDVVAHHVYSFSKPNNFVLPLYKGSVPNPITFNSGGLVTLGCNIHDGMLGYIVVVDTKLYGLSDDDGVISMLVDDTATEYEINIWSPRLRDASATLLKRVRAPVNGMVEFQLAEALRPSHEDKSQAVEWDEY